MNAKYLTLPIDSIEAIDELHDENAGMLLKALMHHVVGEQVELNGEERLIYKMIIKAIDRNIEKYEAVCEKRKNAAESRWNKQNSEMQMDANAQSEMQKHTSAYKNNINKNNINKNNINKDNINKDNKNENNKNNKQQNKTTRFVPPTVDELRAYVLEKGYTFDPQQFIAYYDSVGWMIGNKHMKSWQSACVTWQKRQQSKGQQNTPKSPQKQQPKQVAAQQYAQRKNDITGAFAQFTAQQLAQMMAEEEAESMQNSH